MTKRYFLPDKTFRKFMNFVAKDYLHVFAILQKDISAGQYGYMDTWASHKLLEKQTELEKLFSDVGLDFNKAFSLVNGDDLDFEKYDKGLRKLLKTYYPESYRAVIEKSESLI